MTNLSTLDFEGPSELKLSISIALDKTVRELKTAIAERSDVEADRQRLIYSGKLSRLRHVRHATNLSSAALSKERC